MTELMTSYVSAFGGHLATHQVAAVGILVVGIVATLASDLWQRLLQVLFGLPPASWGLIRGELMIGWAFHYAVGIAMPLSIWC